MVMMMCHFLKKYWTEKTGFLARQLQNCTNAQLNNCTKGLCNAVHRKYVLCNIVGPGSLHWMYNLHLLSLEFTTQVHNALPHQCSVSLMRYKICSALRWSTSPPDVAWDDRSVIEPQHWSLDPPLQFKALHWTLDSLLNTLDWTLNPSYATVSELPRAANHSTEFLKALHYAASPIETGQKWHCGECRL